MPAGGPLVGVGGYLADHDGDGLKVERIDELLDARARGAVAQATIETPEYLTDLIGNYRSAKHDP